jgi:hypothetical protein
MIADHKLVAHYLALVGWEASRSFIPGGSGAKARSAYRSVLDAVTDDVKRSRGRLGAADRGKIEQYLEAVRDVERRIQPAEAQGDRESPIGVPPIFSDCYKLMADLLVLAWQNDMRDMLWRTTMHISGLGQLPAMCSAATGNAIYSIKSSARTALWKRKKGRLAWAALLAPAAGPISPPGQQPRARLPKPAGR